LKNNKDLSDGEEGGLQKAQIFYQPRPPNVLDPALPVGRRRP